MMKLCINNEYHVQQREIKSNEKNNVYVVVIKPNNH